MVGSLTHTKIHKRKKRREILVLKTCHHLLIAPLLPPKSSITLLFFGEKIQTNFQKLLQINAKSTLGWLSPSCTSENLKKKNIACNFYKSISHFELRNLPTQR
jgi:hypothetical protein